MAVSEVQRPLHGDFGSETAKKITAMRLSSGTTAMQRPWSLVKVSGFILKIFVLVSERLQLQYRESSRLPLRQLSA